MAPPVRRVMNLFFYRHINWLTARLCDVDKPHRTGMGERERASVCVFFVNAQRINQFMANRIFQAINQLTLTRAIIVSCSCINMKTHQNCVLWIMMNNHLCNATINFSVGKCDNARRVFERRVAMGLAKAMEHSSINQCQNAFGVFVSIASDTMSTTFAPCVICVAR